jgi:aspartyl-tRNA(Asn)/glutamyl-tRNA(Gln) amidotransferase subunit B
MSKNFQITQYEIPIASGGGAMIGGKKIRIRRIHMEEDPARLVHIGGLGGKHVLVDYNRSGIPLVEIVTEPDFESPAEARTYLQKLVTIIEYLGVYDSASRAVVKSDANISIEGGARIEVKNITGTKEVEQALNYELVRQKNLLKRDMAIKRATRMWNPELGVTEAMRSKEEEEEYGYIFDADLPVMTTDSTELKRIEKRLPELPDKRMERFVKTHRLSEKVAESIVSEIDLAELFEQIASRVDSKLAGTWIAGYLKKTLNWNNLKFRRSGIKPEWMVELLKMFHSGKITDRNAELAIRKMVEEKRPLAEVIKKYKLKKLEDGAKIRGMVERVIKENKTAVQDYKKGEEKALHFLVGEVMREARGQVDAQKIKEIILRLIK